MFSAEERKIGLEYNSKHRKKRKWGLEYNRGVQSIGKRLYSAVLKCIHVICSPLDRYVGVYIGAGTFSRYAGKEEHINISMLPGAVRWRHVHDTDTQKNPLLLFQPDRALRADIEHGPIGLHPAARFWREAHPR